MPRRRILWPTLMVIAKYSSFFAHVYCTLNAVLLFLPLNSYLASFQIQRSWALPSPRHLPARQPHGLIWGMPKGHQEEPWSRKEEQQCQEWGNHDLEKKQLFSAYSSRNLISCIFFWSLRQCWTWTIIAWESPPTWRVSRDWGRRSRSCVLCTWRSWGVSRMTSMTPLRASRPWRPTRKRTLD